jgi:hypothetical protein
MESQSSRSHNHPTAFFIFGFIHYGLPFLSNVLNMLFSPAPQHVRGGGKD